MMNWKKVLGIGVAIGVLLVLVQYALHIDTKVFQMTILFLSIAIFLAVAIYHFCSGKKFRKRVQKQIALMQEGKSEEALRDMESMLPELDKQRNKHTAALCRLNMTACHRDLRQYEQEMEILESLSADEFDGVEKVVYLLNLACCCFYLDQDEKGHQIYTDNKEMFTDYDQHKRYGGSIAALLMFSKIYEGKRDQAERLLEKAKAVWTDRRSQQDYGEVEKKLARTPAEVPALAEEAEAPEEVSE